MTHNEAVAAAKAASTKQEAYDAVTEYFSAEETNHILHEAGWPKTGLPESWDCDCCDGNGWQDEFRCWKCNVEI